MAMLETFGSWPPSPSSTHRKHAQLGQTAVAVPDLVLEILFVAVFVKTR